MFPLAQISSNQLQGVNLKYLVSAVTSNGERGGGGALCATGWNGWREKKRSAVMFDGGAGGILVVTRISHEDIRGT